MSVLWLYLAGCMLGIALGATLGIGWGRLSEARAWAFASDCLEELQLEWQDEDYEYASVSPREVAASILMLRKGYRKAEKRKVEAERNLEALAEVRREIKKSELRQLRWNRTRSKKVIAPCAEQRDLLQCICKRGDSPSAWCPRRSGKELSNG